VGRLLLVAVFMFLACDQTMGEMAQVSMLPTSGSHTADEADNRSATITINIISCIFIGITLILLLSPESMFAFFDQIAVAINLKHERFINLDALPVAVSRWMEWTHEPFIHFPNSPHSVPTDRFKDVLVRHFEMLGVPMTTSDANLLIDLLPEQAYVHSEILQILKRAVVRRISHNPSMDTRRLEGLWDGGADFGARVVKHAKEIQLDTIGRSLMDYGTAARDVADVMASSGSIDVTVYLKHVEEILVFLIDQASHKRLSAYDGCDSDPVCDRAYERLSKFYTKPDILTDARRGVQNAVMLLARATELNSSDIMGGRESLVAKDEYNANVWLYRTIAMAYVAVFICAMCGVVLYWTTVYNHQDCSSQDIPSLRLMVHTESSAELLYTDGGPCVPFQVVVTPSTGVTSSVSQQHNGSSKMILTLTGLNKATAYTVKLTSGTLEGLGTYVSHVGVPDAEETA